MADSKELIVKMVLDSWNGRLQQADKLFAGLSDEQLQEEVAPGRNRGIYLLGHLAAAHDGMLPLLNFGESLFPFLRSPFLEKSDKTVAELPSAADVRSYWTKVNATLAAKIANLKPEQLFERHTSVSEEDFAKEPHRNKLNIIISRTNHLSYHLGQMALLKK